MTGTYIMLLYLICILKLKYKCEAKNFLGCENNITKTYKRYRLKPLDTVENHHHLIFGGRPVKSSTHYPYMAYVFIETKQHRGYKCGGTILGPKHILTAGHCVRNCTPVDENSIVPGAHVKMKCKEFRADSYVIYVGRTIPVLANPKKVKRYFIHPKYKYFDFTNQCYSNYDIAILELRKPLRFNKRISSVRLPRHRLNFINKMCKVLGWGLTKIEVFTNTTIPLREESLKVARAKLINSQQCIDELNRTDYGSIYKDLDLCRKTQLCTMDSKGGSCAGDSGGPLICGGLQVGVVSWGTEQCAGPHVPHVYTRVDVNVKWIQKIISRL